MLVAGRSAPAVAQRSTAVPAAEREFAAARVAAAVSAAVPSTAAKRSALQAGSQG